jgi:hypothetical protein
MLVRLTCRPDRSTVATRFPFDRRARHALPDECRDRVLPGGSVLAWTIHLVLDISIVTLLFAMIFKFLPDAKLSWRDVRNARTSSG